MTEVKSFKHIHTNLTSIRVVQGGPLKGLVCDSLMATFTRTLHYANP